MKFSQILPIALLTASLSVSAEEIKIIQPTFPSEQQEKRIEVSTLTSIPEIKSAETEKVIPLIKGKETAFGKSTSIVLGKDGKLIVTPTSATVN